MLFPGQFTNRAWEYSFERWVGGQVLQPWFRKLGKIQLEIYVPRLRPGQKQAYQERFSYKIFWIQQPVGAHTHPFLLRASTFQGLLFIWLYFHAIAWVGSLFFLLSSLLMTALIIAYLGFGAARWIQLLTSLQTLLSKLCWAAQTRVTHASAPVDERLPPMTPPDLWYQES